jgi:hypothetical protein
MVFALAHTLPLGYFGRVLEPAGTFWARYFAFGTSLARQSEGVSVARKRTVRLKAKVRELFPPNDPMVPPLLRLMALANDLGTLMKIYLHSESRIVMTESEKSIVQAENLYLFRITAATVYEGASIFLEYENELKRMGCSEQTDFLRCLGQTGRDAYYFLENVFCHDLRKFEKTEYGKILVQTRNLAFHYDNADNFRVALQQHNENGELLTGEISGVSRFLLADDLQTQIVLRPIGIELKAIAERMRVEAFIQTTARVSATLTQLADGSIQAFKEKNPQAIFETVNEEVEEERLWIIKP